MFMGCCRNAFGRSEMFDYEEIGSTSTKNKPKTKDKGTEEEKQSILKGKEVLTDGAFPTPRPSLGTKTTTTEENFEQDLLFKEVLSGGAISYATIASYPGGEIKQSNFPVKRKAIRRLIAAIQGDAKYISDHGIKLCNDFPIYMPGPIRENEAVYATPVTPTGSALVEGGCTAMVSKANILVVTYANSKDLETVNRICMEAISILCARGC